MSLKITSVTYQRGRWRTILATGRLSRVKPLEGLREGLHFEIVFTSAGGGVLAS
jgi:hypothetical protein